MITAVAITTSNVMVIHQAVGRRVLGTRRTCVPAGSENTLEVVASVCSGTEDIVHPFGSGSARLETQAPVWQRFARHPMVGAHYNRQWLACKISDRVAAGI